MNWLHRLMLVAVSVAPWGMCGAQADGDGMASFIDGVIQSAVVAHKTAGATVALVQKGRLTVARGYGKADVARGIPVDGRTTQFRIGSISKVLVWMAVMQQVEAGRLDLDADVNSYLTEFQMFPDFSQPITLRHLMTHTPGFEDNVVDLFVTGPRQVGALGETLAAKVPERVYPPGRVVAYSNYGAALAGYLVAQVSGSSWDEYVEEHIFKPLGMNGATTRQPVPRAIEETRAKGYLPSRGGLDEKGFMFVPLAPAGAATATALDMAKLMVELLNPQSSSVLNAASKQLLLGPSRTPHPLVNGLTLGMYEMSLGDARAVGHGGDTLLFSSLMVLWPEKDTGLFVSTNTLGGALVARDLFYAVAQRLGYTAEAAQLEAVSGHENLVGTYISARRNHSNLSKLVGLTNTVNVAYDDAAHALEVSDMLGVRQYQHVGDRVFQRVGGYDRLVFDEPGRAAQALYFSERPMFVYERAERLQIPLVNALLLALWLLAGLSVILIWPVSSVTHRSRPVAKGQQLAGAATFTSMVLVMAFFVQLLGVGDDVYDVVMHGFGRAAPLLWYPVAVAVLVAIQLLYLPRAWVNGYWWVSRRVHFTLVFVAQCALLWWLWYWNLFPPGLLGFLPAN